MNRINLHEVQHLARYLIDILFQNVTDIFSGPRKWESGFLTLAIVWEFLAAHIGHAGHRNYALISVAGLVLMIAGFCSLKRHSAEGSKRTEAVVMMAGGVLFFLATNSAAPASWFFWG